MEKKKMKRWKKVVLSLVCVVIALVVIAGIAVGVTWEMRFPRLPASRSCVTGTTAIWTALCTAWTSRADFTLTNIWKKGSFHGRGADFLYHG